MPGTLEPVIDRTYPLIEAPDAIRYLARGTPPARSSSPSSALGGMASTWH